MPVRTFALATIITLLALAAQAVSADSLPDLPRHHHPGYYTARTVYGYRPYASFVGPLRARYELDPYVYNPRTPGVDYSWGIGYFFGHGPGDRAFQGATRR